MVCMYVSLVCAFVQYPSLYLNTHTVWGSMYVSQVCTIFQFACTYRAGQYACKLSSLFRIQSSPSNTPCSVLSPIFISSLASIKRSPHYVFPFTLLTLYDSVDVPCCYAKKSVSLIPDELMGRFCVRPLKRFVYYRKDISADKRELTAGQIQV